MECSCNIDVGDYEEVKLFTMEAPKAKKQHKCMECGCLIDKGEIYVHEKYLSSDIFYTHRTCTNCFEVRDVIFKDGFFYGHIWDGIADSILDGMTFTEECISQLPKPAREKLCDLIERNWRDDE